LDWLDYVERVGVSAKTDVRAVPLDVRLEDAELDAFSPSWGSAQNLTGAQPKGCAIFSVSVARGDALAFSGIHEAPNSLGVLARARACACPSMRKPRSVPRKLQWLIITLWTETLVLLVTRG
jgi:hypothetical protein